MSTMDDGRPFLTTSELEELRRLKRTLGDDEVMRIQEEVWREHSATHQLAATAPALPGLWRAFLQALRDAVRH